MAKRNRDLLGEIEQAALDESVPVTTALRKCLALGGHAGSAELREWASRELHGYIGHEKELPDYRRIRSPLLMDGIDGGFVVRGRMVSIIDLPEVAREDISDELELTHPIGKIEGMGRQAEARGGSLQMGPAAAAELAAMMTHEIRRMQVERVYWSVSAADFRGVVDGVRTALTELVAEMRAGTGPGAQAPPAEVASQAVQIAVYGDKNRITLNAPIAGEGGTAIALTEPAEAEQSGFWTTFRRIGAAIVGLATVAGAIAAIWALHPF